METAAISSNSIRDITLIPELAKKWLEFDNNDEGRKRGNWIT